MEELWTEFLAKPAGGTSGPRVAQVIQAVSGVVMAEVAFAQEVEGASIADLPVSCFIQVSAFLDACSRVTQFDWADVYLVQRVGDLNVKHLVFPNDYPAAIRQSRASVRVVDGEYVYIYVRSSESLSLRHRIDLIAESEACKIQDLVFPY